MGGEVELYDEGSGNLFHELKAIDKIAPPKRQPSAIEKGHRVWPNGMTEDYERIEFDRGS